MYHYSIKQTVLSLIIMLIIGGILYVLFAPNLFGLASYNNYNNSDTEEVRIFHLPEIQEKEVLPNKIETTGELETQEDDSDYITKLQYLPVYFATMVVDGSTIIVDENRRVRLAGIKAPDKDEEMGMEATDFLKAMIEGKEISLQIDVLNPQDDFGRLRAIIYIENTNVNIEMLRAGLAHVYPVYPSIIGSDDWVSFEEEARKARRGLWGGEKYYNKFIIEDDVVEL